MSDGVCSGDSEVAQILCSAKTTGENDGVVISGEDIGQWHNLATRNTRRFLQYVARFTFNDFAGQVIHHMHLLGIWSATLHSSSGTLQ